MDSSYPEQQKLQNDGRDWADQVEQLLRDWRQRVYAA